MYSIASARVRCLPLAVAAFALAAAGCTIDKASSPSLSAPSAFNLVITSSASPDIVPRDGESTATLRFSVRDFQDEAVPGQRLVLTTTAGSLNASDVTTDANGIATAVFTAPSVNQAATSAVITATPVGGDLGTAISGNRTVTIGLAGPTVPVAAFTFAPSAPGALDLVTFDGTTTTLGGAACGEACTYDWDFGDGSTASGRLAGHRFASAATYSVRLTVTGPGGVVASSSRSLTVGAPAAITAVITQSPTDAKVSDTVIFDASGSSTPDGAAIASYSWDFGNGVTSTAVQASTTYGQARTYTVRLTIVDALGRTATTTKTVTIAN